MIVALFIIEALACIVCIFCFASENQKLGNIALMIMFIIDLLLIAI